MAVGDYDRTQPLVIDPILSYAASLGGGGQDEGNAVAVDDAGNVDVPTFVHVQAMAPERLKILAISSNVAVREQSRRERAFRVPNVALFILRKLTDGTVRFHGRWEDEP